MVKSYASSVKLDTDQPISYEQQEGISDSFAEAGGSRDDLMELYAEQTEQGERESEMVKEDAMTHDMRPPPEIAAEQDREVFDAKWEAERENARDDLMADYADQISDESDNVQERDRDLGLEI